MIEWKTKFNTARLSNTWLKIPIKLPILTIRMVAEVIPQNTMRNSLIGSKMLETAHKPYSKMPKNLTIKD